ncbi:DUF6069 family protein [Nocardiopsis sp. EMB25]|uniref:DUF6069 family protein n=1 Tax=Nocardiopsis TaxID=2013 RepID=UPI00034B98F1|nr:MULTISPECIES: DUF6069 family protein [Nocardiopsis]MCY9784610.1 DUF6069 family protein [Nocardiopsis sp. EMB25]
MTATSPETRTTRTRRGAWKPRLGAIAAASVATAVVGGLAPFLGVDMVIEMPGMEPGPVPVPAFVLWTALFGLIGWGALALAERLLGARGRLLWTVVAVVFTAVSCVPSVSVGGGAATEAVLVFTHVLAAAILIPVFWRSSTVA